MKERSTALKDKMLPLEEVRVQGLRSLAEKLGPYNFVRFIQQYNCGTGDYTKERSRVKSISIVEIGERIKKRRKKR
jgi:hypothetical protein